MNVSVLLDDQELHQKPAKGDNLYRLLNNRITTKPINYSLSELAVYIGENGRTFCPAIFKGTRRNQASFQEMQLFALDFDEGPDYQCIQKRCDAYSLPIAFSYHTLSSTDKTPKYRIVLCHIVPITESYLAKLIMGMLKQLFPEADAHCFDIARMFLGGKRLIEVHKAAIFRLDQLTDSFQTQLYNKDKSNFARSLTAFARKYEIGMHGRLLGIGTCGNGINFLNSTENDENFGKNNIKSLLLLPENSSIFILTPSDQKQSVPSKQVSLNKKQPRAKQELLLSACPLCREFFSGEYLDHASRFQIATNLCRMEGGRKLFLDTIKRFYPPDTLNRWEYQILKISNDYNYQPQSCENSSCPYKNTCCHDTNIILTACGRSPITELQHQPYISLEEAREILSANLQAAVKAKDQSIYLIRAQTGLGKTFSVIQLLRNTKELFILAEPTVEMKHEIYQELQNAGIPCTELMSLKDLILPSDFFDELQSFYNSGFYKEAKCKIRNFADALPPSEQRRRCEAYLKNQEALQEGNSHIVMTHAQLMNLKTTLSSFQIIVDEDILLSCTSAIHSIPVSEVEKALEHGVLTGEKAQELRSLLSSPDKSYQKSSYIDRLTYKKAEELQKFDIYGNINDLFSASSYFRDDEMLHYFVPKILPHQKLIILSATLDEHLYQAYFPNQKTICLDVPEVAYKGRVIQYTRHSLSRRNFSELAEEKWSTEEIINRIKYLSPDTDYGISFKANDSIIQQAFQMKNTPLHFGNSMGTNAYRGTNGVIIGTPHLNELAYKLPACYMGANVKETAKRRKVRYNGYSFTIMTYKNPLLQRLQLYRICNELEQSIGRSRLLSENATVYVFSNFPCRQAKLNFSEYLS